MCIFLLHDNKNRLDVSGSSCASFNKTSAQVSSSVVKNSSYKGRKQKKPANKIVCRPFKML